MIFLKREDCLPKELQNDKARFYHKILKAKTFTLFIKRAFDIAASFIGLVILLLPFAVTAAVIKATSRGPVFFVQERMGRYYKPFKIIKFRTMKTDNTGLKITVGDDDRITRIGAFLRKTKADELPQLINVLLGQMSFVGPRPEVLEYVKLYTDEMSATLLVRPGITSSASIKYRKESEILAQSDDPERAYIDVVLPDKMKYNLEYIENISAVNDLKLIFKTVF